jgi:hypothetical protein
MPGSTRNLKLPFVGFEDSGVGCRAVEPGEGSGRLVAAAATLLEFSGFLGKA